MNKQKNANYFEMDPKTEYIKIFGLQRSGTNYLSHLINENFENTKAMVNVGGWKHGYYAVPWAVGKELHIAAITKSPYAWLVSMYNYWGPKRKKNIGPDMRGVSFDHFVRNKAIFEKQRDIPFLIRAENPVQHWNDMNFHWSSIRMNGKKLCFVTYEAVLQDSNAILEAISTNLEIKRKDKVTNSDKRFVPAGENMQTSDEVFGQKDYYLKGGFLKEYTPELLEFVNDQIDLDLMVHFGYNVLTPEDIEKSKGVKQ